FTCDRLTVQECVAMVEANKALVRRWFKEVWNDGREAAIDELFSANGIAYGLGDTEAPVHGPSEMKPFVRNLRGTIGNLHVRIEDIMAEEDKVMVRVVLEGTHSGAGLGVAPTGRPVRVAGIILIRVENDELVEGW